MGRDKSIMGDCAKRSKSGNKARNDEAGRRGTDRTESRRAMRREADGAAPCLRRLQGKRVEAMQDVSGGATEGAAPGLAGIGAWCGRGRWS